MLKLKEITSCLEQYAPLAYQESYDNAGLICGDPDMEVNGAVICLDSTEEVLDEAISLGCNLVIAHHPIVFSGLKKINGKNYIERVIIKAIRHNIAIYAAHTNLDAVANGVNSMIVSRLGLEHATILAPASKQLKKLVVFCPDSHADMLRNSLFEAGGGQIGNYDECSFSVKGEGTFRAGEGSNPFVGEKGTRHAEAEERIELIYPAYLEKKLLAALFRSHPYEVPAFDLIELSNASVGVGSGMIGQLPEALPELEFLKRLKGQMNTECIRYTQLRGKEVKKVAVCGGSGSFLLQQAIQAGADVFVTGDFKYHQFFDAENRIVIADIGHYESEQFTGELFYGILKKKFSTFALHLSKINTNPVKYL